jgi:hypothetical protein
MIDVQKLTTEIAAIVPIHGVSIGDPADKQTWRVDYIDEPDAQSAAAVQAVISAFNAEIVDVASISDRQFAQQLAIIGTITEDEALAWAARGDLPEAIETAIAAMPEGERFGARMLLASATTYERAHPLVPALADLLGYDAEALDDLWRAAAAL